MKWKRCYGLEGWTFAEDGRMRKRQMSGNDMLIDRGEGVVYGGCGGCGWGGDWGGALVDCQLGRST